MGKFSLLLGCEELHVCFIFNNYNYFDTKVRKKYGFFS